ncbi:class I SAM-dependent methyltransferase [Pontibacter sp. 13R65]|uniref:class I SAM-dependent methyltransferase n=1 Tax=Pontibacter sp. 13R65 TaxID=3127458 RepID=UPI00301D29E4
MQEAQQALLPYIAEQDRVLLIGGGSGWLLEQILLHHPKLKLLYLEASPKMLQMAQNRYRRLQVSGHQVEFRLGTEALLHETDVFDVIFTPFLLDLFLPHRLHLLMNRLANSLAPEGLWLFSDFWPVATPPLWWQQLLLKSMYTFFGMVSQVRARSLPDFKSHFEQLQLEEVYSSSYAKGMVQSKVFQRKSNQ